MITMMSIYDGRLTLPGKPRHLKSVTQLVTADPTNEYARGPLIDWHTVLCESVSWVSAYLIESCWQTLSTLFRRIQLERRKCCWMKREEKFLIEVGFIAGTLPKFRMLEILRLGTFAAAR